MSSVLSFLLWTYQPNYDVHEDTSYVSEVDVGGNEKTKGDLIKPKQIVFHHDEDVSGFNKPIEKERFFKDLSSWVLYEYEESDVDELPDANKMVEIIFPDQIPAETITNLFTFDESRNVPSWLFDRAYLLLDEEEEIIEFVIVSMDERRQITATIDKTETYYYLLTHMEDETEITTPYFVFDEAKEPIYLPNYDQEYTKKTFVANMIEPEVFVNALFSTPSIVTSNVSEAYFTDGQRGMEVVQDGRRLEYTNPIQSKNNRLDALELIDRSIDHINEHKGWTNDFSLEDLDVKENTIKYRMHYEGYPAFERYRLTTIEEKWREQELYQYIRPVVSVGNLLNSSKKEIPTAEEVVSTVKESGFFELEDIDDIRLGYTMDYVEDAYSLTLSPDWYISYNGDWIPFYVVESEQDKSAKKGGD